MGCESKKSIYLAGWISILFSSIMYLITYVVGGYFAIIGEISVGLVISLSQLIGGVVAPLEQLPAILAEIRSTLQIRNKLENIIIERSFQEIGNVLKSSPREISMKNVSFSYDNSEVKAINNVSLRFEEYKSMLLLEKVEVEKVLLPSYY